MVLEQLYAAFDVLFGPVVALQPLYAITIISAIITVLVILINRFAVDRKLMKEIKNKMEETREQLTQAQKAGDKEKTDMHFKDMMKINNDLMKQNFKAIIISLIVISLIFPWIKYRYNAMVVAAMPFEVPVIGINLTWLYWYILVSFAIGWFINKLIGN
jgi:uncharacterized membrane protein (DUF106 family)